MRQVFVRLGRSTGEIQPSLPPDSLGSHGAVGGIFCVSESERRRCNAAYGASGMRARGARFLSAVRFVHDRNVDEVGVRRRPTSGDTVGKA